MGVQRLEKLLIELDEVLRWVSHACKNNLTTESFWDYDFVTDNPEIAPRIKKKVANLRKESDGDYYEYSGLVQELFEEVAVGGVEVVFQADVRNLLGQRQRALQYVRSLHYGASDYLEQKLKEVDFGLESEQRGLFRRRNALPEAYTGDISYRAFLYITFRGLVPKGIDELSRVLKRFYIEKISRRTGNTTPEEVAKDCFSTVRKTGLNHGFEYVAGVIAKNINILMQPKFKMNIYLTLSDVSRGICGQIEESDPYLISESFEMYFDELSTKYRILF